MIKKTVKILAILALIIGIDRFCHDQTGTFSLHKILLNRADDPVWEPEHQANVDHLLSQRYTFLGNGNECFAFLSEDQTTVLKVFKLQFLRPAYIKQALASPLAQFKEEMISARKQRLQRTFESLHIAYNDLKESTGLVYIHLTPTQTLQKSLKIIDKLSIEHTIDLDTTKFVLQKKAELVYPRIHALMQQDSIEEAKAHLDSLLDLLAARSKKGIADRDARVEANFGFIGNQAVEIDVGSFSYDPSVTETETRAHILFQETLPLKAWLEKHYPILLGHLNEKIASL